MKGYADFLFKRGDYEKGREMYKEALKILKNDSDDNRYTNGYTYFNWYVSESNYTSNEIAEEFYHKSLCIFNSIGAVNYKNTGLQHLSIRRNQILKNTDMAKKLTKESQQEIFKDFLKQ